MNRVRPTKTIDVIGNLDISPETGAGFYLKSKQNEKFCIKPPNYDSVGCDNIDVLVYQAKREHDAMYKMQTEMIEKSRQQEQVNKMRVKQLYEDQQSLRNEFIEMNEFLKNCDDKKKHCSEIIQAEQKKQAELRKILAKYQNDIAVLTEFRDVLLGVVKDLEPYEKIVDKIIEKSGEFSSTKECMDRCDAIMLAHSEIEKMFKEKQEMIEARRMEMIKLTNEACQTILGYMTELAFLERNYEDARINCNKWEKTLVRTKDHIIETQLNQIRLVQGINGMYSLLCRRRGISADLENDDVEQQLDFIKDEMEVLQKVIEACKGTKRREKVMKDQ